MHLSLKEIRILIPETSFLWLPAIAVILVYLPSLDNGLVWDDYKAFVQYPYYRDISYLWRTFNEPLVFLPDYYRPLTSATYTLQNHFLGVSAQSLHAASLGLHLVNTALVACLLRVLLRQWDELGATRSLPLVAGLLYGLHPALTESVAFASVRFDQMVTLFLLLALIADRSITHRIWRPVSVAVLFLLAALSKEMAAALALVLPVLHLACAREQTLNPVRWTMTLYRQRDLHVYLAILISGLVYLLIRYQALGYLVSVRTATPTVDVTGAAHVLLVFRSLSEYLTLMLFPFNQLTPAHPITLPFSASDAANWWPLITGAVCAGLLTASRWVPRSSWLLIATMLSLAPVLNILPLTRPAGAYFSESYLVFPVALAVIAILVLSAEVRLKVPEKYSATWARTNGGVLLTWLIGSALVISATLPIWKSDHSLWLWASTRHPDSATAQTNLASALIEKGRFDEALVVADKAVRLGPGNASTWTAKARAVSGLKRYNEAVELLEKAIVISGGSVEQWHNLAQTRLAQGELEIARNILLQAVITHEPDNVQALGNLGLIYLRQGDNANALHYFRETRKRAVDKRRIDFLDRQIQELETRLAK